MPKALREILNYDDHAIALFLVVRNTSLRRRLHADCVVGDYVIHPILLRDGCTLGSDELLVELTERQQRAFLLHVRCLKIFQDTLYTTNQDSSYQGTVCLPAASTCTACRAHLGPFAMCYVEVVVRNSINSCTNCYFTGQAAECSAGWYLYNLLTLN